MLFFLQRSMLFPIPHGGPSRRQRRAFREVEEHVLTTADGEKIIVWHVPAKPGHPVISISTATAIISPASSAASAIHF